MIFFYLFQIWNIIKFLIAIYKINNNNIITDDDVSNLKNIINNIGVFAIKLVQWSEAKMQLIYGNNEKYKGILEMMQTYYENCSIHPYEKTKDLYFNDFKTNLENDIILENNLPIASGSIGQVYKGVYKKDNTQIAIKCIHPSVHNDLIIPKLLFSLYLNYLSKVPFMAKFTLPFDMNEFFNSLEEQINMVNEAKNMNKMQTIYKDNPYIIVPRVIKKSSNFLLMTFENGKSFNDDTISQYKKYKIATLYKIFNLNNYCITGFSHGDLHIGNWKVQNESIKGLNPIIILDYGLCVNYPPKFITDFINAISDENSETIIELLFSKNAIHYNPHNNIDTNIIKQKIKKMISSYQNLTIKDIQYVLPLMVREKIILSSIFLNIFIGFILISNITKDNTDNTLRFKNKHVVKDSFYKVQYPAVISFCKTYNIFHDYKKTLQKRVDNFLKNNEIELFETSVNIVEDANNN